MTTSKHPTSQQIRGFYLGGLVARNLQEVRQHLLICTDCRRSLPFPTPQLIHSAVVGNESTTTHSPGQRASFIPCQLQHLIQLLRSNLRLVLSAGTLALLIVLTAFFLTDAIRKSSTDRLEIAEGGPKPDQHFSSDDPPNRSQHLDDPVRAANRSEIGDILVANQSRPRPAPGKRGLDQKLSRLADKGSRGNVGRGQLSATRGATVNCAEAMVFDMTIGLMDAYFSLKWKPIPGAAKYHLYVSDEDEVLLEEFETDKDTFYQMKKPLDLRKFYRWRVVIAFHDGRTASVVGQRFGGIEVCDKIEPNSKRRAEIRCSASNP